MTLPTSRNNTYTSLSKVRSADLNDIQDQIIALSNEVRGDLYNWLYAGLLQQIWSDGNTGTSHVRTFGVAGMCNDSANRTINVKGGLLVADTGPGDRPYVAAVIGDFVAGVDVTLPAVPGAGIWRRDILEVKLEEDGNGKIVVTTNVKQGSNQASAGAADANEPATTSGYEKLASFLTRESSAAMPFADIKDYRSPVGGDTLWVPVSEFVTAAGEWAIANAQTGRIDSTGASKDILIPVRALVGRPRHGRVREIALRMSLNASATLHHMAVDWTSNAGPTKTVDITTGGDGAWAPGNPAGGSEQLYTWTPDAAKPLWLGSGDYHPRAGISDDEVNKESTAFRIRSGASADKLWWARVKLQPGQI